MTTERSQPEREEEEPGAAGMPGDGAGRREEPGRTGVHPASAGWPEGDMELVREGEWGQGERGLAGYEDHGESELSPRRTVSPGEGGGSLIKPPDAGSPASTSEAAERIRDADADANSSGSRTYERG
jgi:hypothetical protein